MRGQAHEGWRLIPGRFDDGAFSGASLDRPALQQLLADVRAGKIDIVLVYKVDRLTRSLADFAKLIELFDAHGVSFVSVTQSFNTSSSSNHLNARGGGKGLPDNDRDVLERHLERVTLTPNHLELRLRELVEPAQAHDPADTSTGRLTASVTTMAVPWTSPVPAAVKGIIHVPAHNTPIKASRREALLIAIAKARQWIDDLAHGRAANFALIARREGKVERHIRLLAPLAFVSPRIVSALLDGTAPADLTLTKLARALPYCWAEQERRVGTSAPFHC